MKRRQRRRVEQGAGEQLAAAVQAQRIEQIVQDLVTRFWVASDVPSEHRCSPACSHDQDIARPLLVRLEELVEPGTTKGGEGTKHTKGAKAGSPAPWDPTAAELLDEILHGAVDLARSTRQALGFDPLMVRYRVAPARPPASWHPPLAYPLRTVTVEASKAPVENAGRRALRDLLVTMPVLQERNDGHWLIRGDRVSNKHPERGYRHGAIEDRLRRWHHQAQLVTGHKLPPVVLRQMANPVEIRENLEYSFWRPQLDDDGEPLLGENDKPLRERVAWKIKGRREIEGPLCWRCHHSSCARIAYSHMGPWVTVRCPHCGTPGLPQDPVTEVIYCPRPSCRDEDGGRHEWMPSALKRLGLEPVEADPSRLRYTTSTEEQAS